LRMLQEALTSFFGIGHATARRVCARMQIHDRCRVRDLTPSQILSLTAFLSSPQDAPDAPHHKTASPNFKAPSPTRPPLPLPRASSERLQPGTDGKGTPRTGRGDPLKNLKIETVLKKEILDNIAHHRMIGSYVGRRHALALPVRGQNTQSNAKTAKKFNRLDRYL